MALTSHRNIFKGKLNGIAPSELFVLDYTKEKLKDRKKEVEEKIESTIGFYNEFISSDKEYYKVNLSKDDYLSEHINVFKALDKDASYILNSKDLDKGRQCKYSFLKEEEFNALLRKEKSLNAIFDSNVDEDVMVVLKRENVNDFINMKLSITKEDLKREDSGIVLSDYNRTRNYLKGQIEKIKNREDYEIPLYKARNLLKGINDDMLLAKNQLQGIRCQAKKLGDESGKFYLDMIDYTNASHIKAILESVSLSSLEPSSNISHIAFDMKQAIIGLKKHNSLDKIDMYIIESKNFGISNVAIAKELGIGESLVRYKFKNICEKVSSYYTYISFEKNL